MNVSIPISYQLQPLAPPSQSLAPPSQPLALPPQPFALPQKLPQRYPSPVEPQTTASDEKRWFHLNQNQQWGLLVAFVTVVYCFVTLLRGMGAKN